MVDGAGGISGDTKVDHRPGNHHKVPRRWVAGFAVSQTDAERLERLGMAKRSNVLRSDHGKTGPMAGAL